MFSARCLERERQLKYRLLQQVLWYIAAFPPVTSILPETVSYLLLVEVFVFLCLGALHNVSGKRSDLYWWHYCSRNQCYLWCDIREEVGNVWTCLKDKPRPLRGRDASGNQDR